MKTIKNINKKGFTLLLASLIASLLLALGLSMFTIAQKELMLSGLGRESQYAFYAADTGAECALYWDFKNAFDQTQEYVGAKCNGESIGRNSNGKMVLGGQGYASDGTASEEFWFNQTIGSKKRCIKVTVTKYDPSYNPPHDLRTKIKSLGYNTECDAVGNLKITPRTLERAVEMQY